MEKSIILVLPVLGMALIGYLVVKFGWFSQAAADGVGRFAVAVAVPVLVFQTMASSKLPKDLGNLWELLGSYYGGALVAFILAMAVARFAFHGSASEQGAYGTYAANSNVVLLGLPAVILVLGSKWTTLMILVATHGLVMAMLATIVIGLSRRQTANLPQNLWKDVAGQAKNPILIALVAGLLANQFNVSLPGPASKIIAQFANAAVPCALFAAGGTLARFSMSGITQQNAAICALKLAAFPMIVWVLATQVVNIPTSWTWIAVMLATMPIDFDVQSKGRGGDADSSTVALSNLLGAVSLMVLTYIIVT